MADEAIVPLYVTLPFPPSVNNIWRGGKGGRHYLSAKYKSWREAAALIAKSQTKGKQIKGPYALQINVSRPDKRKRDLDNLLKAVVDLLVHVGVTSDDSELQMIEAQWIGKGECVWIAIRPCLRWGEVS